jgi:hypothetical protein
MVTTAAARTLIDVGSLWQKFKTGNIKPEEVAELGQILENETYQAISEGNVGILFTITSMLIEIDDYRN